MTNQLAKYLFDNEVLYKEGNVNKQPKPLPIEKPLDIPSVEAPRMETPRMEIPRMEIPGTDISIEEKTNSQKPEIEFSHKVLILVKSIESTEKEFLSKILSAVNLTLEQVDLIELKKIKGTDYQSFIGNKTTSTLISFGVGMTTLNWDIMLIPYQIKPIGGINFLLADNLHAIAESPTLKKSLWAALQKLFLA